ncbi:hypothetical protein FRACYDRAFT_221351 [Fragilariopsis cylindrus CCMP1102]|uniref:Uncharacterized protein n=1 Tax=Fragilariopsis cylindrus CCMP1102 TaxID=635003 RepID=A0A1E7EMS6_9STRA|nr:hypothetical protein FRACYDRAFT_221351 [Fragilariopsis cylindrus CCMP1102]|eukprot:OEU07134.1 hypothetical protein FRACYDRAFT_221351 [Fragilariopsis cylindrus CCMP1102]
MILMNLLLVAAALLIANTSSVNGQQDNRTTTVGSGLQCGKVGDINTAFLQIQRGDDDESAGGTYTVSYTFDWGPTSYQTFTEIPYGVETTVNSTNIYNTPGVYNAGYKVEFCDDDGVCRGDNNGGDDTFSITALLKIDDDSCVWGYTTPSPSATIEPTSAPTYALSPTIVSSSSGLLYSFFPALTMSGILTMVLS